MAPSGGARLCGNFATLMTTNRGYAASQQISPCMLLSAKAILQPADALRRTAFLDVSSLNFGGAKSTAVFLL